MTDEALIESAMRRALVLAAHGPHDGINPRVGCEIGRASCRERVF